MWKFNKLKFGDLWLNILIENSIQIVIFKLQY